MSASTRSETKPAPPPPDVINPVGDGALSVNAGGETLDISGFKSVDVMEWPDSFYVSVIASRRSGKSFMVNYLLQQFQKSRRSFTHVFLVSPTDSGFDGIPKKYRFPSMDAVDYVVEQQKKIKAHNMKMKDKEDKVTSRVCIVVDDCACLSGADSLRSSKTLEHASMNGRHYGNDGVPGNGISFFLISQSLTRISRAIRLNQDCFLFNAIASAREAEMILDECFFINTRRDAKRTARDLYETLTTSKDFRFVCVENYIQNKKVHTDFIRTVDAVEEKDFQFFGNQSDDESDGEEEDQVFRGGGIPTPGKSGKEMSGGRTFISSGKPKFNPF